MAVDRKAQVHQIGAEDFGGVEQGVGRGQGGGRTGTLMGVEEDQVEEEEEEVLASVLILWHVTGAGCVAIWPVTIPKPVTSQREAV